MGIKDTYENDESQVLLKIKGEVIHPKTKKPIGPKYLDGPSEVEAPDEDVREKLAAWITAPKNPWFARAITNRMVKHYLGRGMVEPVDDFRVTNPPSNQALLDALAKDFVDNGYSLHHMARVILNSRVYQLTSEPNETNRTDTINYSRYYVKRLMAEQLADSITEVTGVPEKYPGYMLGTHAMAIPQGAPSYFLATFGRMKAREVICERDTQPDMVQAMHLISGETLMRQTTAKGGNLDKWTADASLTDEDVVRKIFLAAVVREPDHREIETALLPLQAKGAESRRQAFEDVLWTVFNSKEFLFNH